MLILTNNMSNILYKWRVVGGRMNNRVRELRARFGYSQENLAKAIGVTRQTVQQLKREITYRRSY